MMWGNYKPNIPSNYDVGLGLMIGIFIFMIITFILSQIVYWLPRFVIYLISLI